MKYHKNTVNAVIDSLQQVFQHKKYTDKVLEKVLKLNPQWGSRDRKFIAETVYEITRNYRLLSEIAGSKLNFKLIFAAYLWNKNFSLPEWQDFASMNTSIFSENKKNIILPEVLYSYPEPLWNLCENELGEKAWLKEAEALNHQAGVVLRTNTLKISKKELIASFEKDGISVSEIKGFSEALLLEKRQNVFSTSQFKNGFFEVQDAGSQLISGFLSPEPGHKIIDACAGGGGKSLHLSALTKNKGKILALDIEQWKLDNLQKRARRAGAYNIETRIISGKETIQKLENWADRLLLDVPCSGTGVIKRNPDTKYKITPEIIEKTRQIQFTILVDYSAMLKKGGQMVYSTCSILPSENQKQVEKFLALKGKEFSLIKDKTILPSEGFDGFYMALIGKIS